MAGGQGDFTECRRTKGHPAVSRASGIGAQVKDRVAGKDDTGWKGEQHSAMAQGPWWGRKPGTGRGGPLVGVTGEGTEVTAS